MRERERERESEASSFSFIACFINSPLAFLLFWAINSPLVSAFLGCEGFGSARVIMALMLDSAASVALISHHATAMASSPSPTFGAQASLALPRSAGLRVFFSASRSAAGMNPHHRTHLRTSRGIVCEQQQEIIAPASGAVTDKTWKDLVLDSDIPVLVDFWAPWCGPCRMIAPIVDELAKLYAGRIRCLKLNTDESPNKATEYGIRSIPTVLIFKGGEKKAAVVGAVPKATLTTTIEKYLDR